VLPRLPLHASFESNVAAVPTTIDSTCSVEAWAALDLATAEGLREVVLVVGTPAAAWEMEPMALIRNNTLCQGSRNKLS
jgi:hypothetical protein